MSVTVYHTLVSLCFSRTFSSLLDGRNWSSNAASATLARVSDLAIFAMALPLMGVHTSPDADL
jgi:hypothetical protein